MLVTQSCLTSDPKDCSPPGSSVHGIFQARILEWVAFPFSRGSSRLRDGTQVSCIAVDSLLSEPPGEPPFPLLHPKQQPSEEHLCFVLVCPPSLLSLPSKENLVIDKLFPGCCYAAKREECLGRLRPGKVE